MTAAIRAIAGATLREALRSRLAWLLAALVLGAIGLSGFLQAVVPAEGRSTQAALLGALLRLGAVALVAVFTVTSVVREFQERQADLLVALPLPRATWLLGRLAGFGMLALLPALLAGLLVLLVAPAAQAGLWMVALLGELWIVATFAVFCTLTLQQALPALCATFGFYLLARSVAALQRAGHGGPDDPAQRVISGGVDALALLLPRLDAFARSEWLVYHTGGAADLGFVALQTAITLLLVGGAALFDLYRRAF
ncbi:hypothetical protein IP91_00531 [Pseudoduganella lurida]|uniref:Uncharacterized protein n=1 Tax=Pseudoduganella lurida TaxID=1036180 RepID=A0A562RKL3_9BURK|nr:ABC transporter permease [Pseudoduganella lurida]TWI69463.1 hypothetical protein IP91_00531 [Pseudoduganella lurida]